MAVIPPRPSRQFVVCEQWLIELQLPANHPDADVHARVEVLEADLQRWAAVAVGDAGQHAELIRVTVTRMS